MDIQLFASNFLDQQPPAALVSLWDAHNDESIIVPDGLELYEEGDGNMGIEAGWTSDEAALSRLFGFAQANHSGSVYALWQAHEDQHVDEMPVVLFGDEGGQLLIASNTHEWIKLLITNIAPHIETNWDTDEQFISFGTSEVGEEEDEEADEGVEVFRGWLATHFGYESISPEEVMQCVQKAQNQYQAAFDEWLSPFLP